jgi:signal transduction histidine kinase
MKTKVVLVPAAILLVFAVVVALVTWRLRDRIRSEILSQEGTVLHAVAHYQAARGGQTPLDLVLGMVDIDGILGIRTYRPDGEPAAALPSNLVLGRLPEATVQQLGACDSLTVYEPDAVLYTLFADPFRELTEEPLPILRVTVNLEQDLPGRDGSLVEFILEGSRTAASLAELDRHLLTQSLLAFGVGGGAILGVLILSLRSLERKNRQLAETNRDLTLHLKTAAVGAVTAHLFHALKHAVEDLDEEGRAAALQAMIQEALDVIQDEARGIAYTLDGAEIVEFAARPVRALAASRGVDLVLDGGRDAQFAGRHGNLLVLALQNLLRNAVEASPAGTTVECRFSGNGRGSRVEVTDHGAGIPDEHRRHLFESGYSAKPGGQGIGLSISRQLCRLIGGELRLADTGAQGSRFEIRLPGQDTVRGV